MIKRKIGIIGGGNLGKSIAEGLVKSNIYKSDDIIISRRKDHLLEDLKASGIQVTRDNCKVSEFADLIILSVKPHQALDIFREIAHTLHSGKTVISVVTGISMKQIQETIDPGIPLFRAMPNTAIAIRESMTCLATCNGNDTQTDEVVQLFNHLGKTQKINEDLMDAATVLAACGIAYALRFIRAASQGGIQIGFDARTAQSIAAQTVRGAAGLLIEGGQHPEWEIDKVTTPKGITIAGLNEMEHQGFSSSLIRGIITSFDKIARND